MPNSVGENQTKRKLKAGELDLFMGVNQMRTPNIAMIAAACGFDGIYIDLEHNPTSLETAAAICVAALGLGMTPIARVRRSVRRDPDSRLRRPRSDGPACQHRGRGQSRRRGLPLSAMGSPLRLRLRPGARLFRSVAGRNQHLSERTNLVDRDARNAAVDRERRCNSAVDGIDVVHIGSSDLSTEMGIPGQYQHARMREAYEATAKAARSHGKSFGVGGVREDLEFQTWLLRLGMRYLTGGSDVGYILSAGRADVKRIREARLT